MQTFLHFDTLDLPLLLDGNQVMMNEYGDEQRKCGFDLITLEFTYHILAMASQLLMLSNQKWK